MAAAEGFQRARGFRGRHGGSTARLDGSPPRSLLRIASCLETHWVGFVFNHVLVAALSPFSCIDSFPDTHWVSFVFSLMYQ